ncbi:uncharacterized protein LOC125833804 [Solanum verrucosum]|uniref:uncharacterized protein LOC125833804 n=1 Tax=Solanum verrucosum TaxID=315347 RepID=UPI0020D05659|nr:uncharacterized protein LOC125833804 [Solanum verrucosum]
MNAKRIGWSKKLDDALWGYRTMFKTPIGMSPYQLVFGKSWHLPVELENKVIWALKKQYLDWDVESSQRLNDLNELNEFHLKAYKSSALYKQKMKRLRLFPGKLKSKCKWMEENPSKYSSETVRDFYASYAANVENAMPP